MQPDPCGATIGPVARCFIIQTEERQHRTPGIARGPQGGLIGEAQITTEPYDDRCKGQ